jgi:hypothetical protein
MQATSTPQLTEKEIIATFSFRENINVKQHPDLNQQIQNAQLLGNNHHSKVTIVFQDDSGVKRVDTTIWASGAKYICLKGGVWLPISRILEIKL